MKAAYVRVYYSIIDDEKFVGIYDNDHHLAAWLRLLMAADAVWPASATLPAAARKASLLALSEAGLIDITGHRYRVRGLDAERTERRTKALISNDQKCTDRSPSGDRSVTERSPATRAGASARLGTTERDTPGQDRARDPEGPVLAYLASVHAAIAPTGNGYHIRLVKLVQRHGAETVLATMRHLHDTGARTDRQLLFGAENALDAIPASRNGTKTKGYAPSAEEAERAFR